MTNSTDLTIEYTRLKALQKAETGQLLPRKGHVNYWCEMDNAILLIEKLMQREAKLRNFIISTGMCGDELMEELYPSEYSNE